MRMFGDQATVDRSMLCTNSCFGRFYQRLHEPLGGGDIGVVGESIQGLFEKGNGEAIAITFVVFPYGGLPGCGDCFLGWC